MKPVRFCKSLQYDNRFGTGNISLLRVDMREVLVKSIGKGAPGATPFDVPGFRTFKVKTPDATINGVMQEGAPAPVLAELQAFLKGQGEQASDIYATIRKVDVPCSIGGTSVAIGLSHRCSRAPGARGGGARGAQGAGAPAAGARGGGPAAQNANSVSPIEFLIEPPTLINLGFEWFIQGDENRNATVTVSYRKKGETAWKPALPMLRLKGERVYQASQVDVISPNMFAGSILDLEPDTAYEAQFVMADPDGIRGESRRMVTVRTRPEPQPYEGGRVFHVYPHGFQGQKIEPSFEGLMCAYNYSCAGNRLGDFGQAARSSGRYDPGPRRRVQIQPLRIHQRRVGQQDRTAGWHLLPHGRRYTGNADRHQGCRRRPGDF